MSIKITITNEEKEFNSKSEAIAYLQQLKKLLHKLAHLLRCNYGVADAYYEGSILMMSFKCTGCGKRSHIHPVHDWNYKYWDGKKIDILN